MWRRATLFLAVVVAALSAGPARAEDQSLDALQEKIVKAAAKAVAPSVVQIETSGGKDVFVRDLDDPRKVRAATPWDRPPASSSAPTATSSPAPSTSPISRPASPSRVPGHKEGYIADVIATDKTRMLALLKIRTAPEKPLVVPPIAPKADIKVGQTAIALGRTLNPNPNDVPSVSVGIISATGRIWGQGASDRRQGQSDQLRRPAGGHPGARAGHPGAAVAGRRG